MALLPWIVAPRSSSSTPPMIAVMLPPANCCETFDCLFAERQLKIEIRESDDGSVERIVEYKDATDEERKITEYNAGLYLVRSPWIWHALDRIEPSEVTGEYYLTDIVSLAIADGYKVAAVGVHKSSEAHGINTPGELEIAEQLLKERE